MQRIHNSRIKNKSKEQTINSLDDFYCFSQKNNHLLTQTTNHKPIGLWYSFTNEYNWLDWTKTNQPKWLGKHTYEILLIEEPKILVLKDLSDLNAFFSKYQIITSQNNYIEDFIWIDWPQVATTYSGIEIINYNIIKKQLYNQLATPIKLNKSISYKLYWLSCWDISSGCIWNKNIIKHFKLIP